MNLRGWLSNKMVVRATEAVVVEGSRTICEAVNHRTGASLLVDVSCL